MCGIAGVVNWGDSAVLARMTDVQAHRGPDDAGLWETSSPDGTYVGLGSRRLAILDLSHDGHMPMANAQGNLWITYNGEIYNFRELRAGLEAKGHRFVSRTDTEVVLRLYEQEGADCVRQLEGIFAFAICDLRRGSPVLFLARDHFGVKPFYYVQRGNQFAFASEIKALLQLPGCSAEIDPEALHQYLSFLWVPDPRTMFRGIWKLPAGHYALWRNGQLETRQYWDLEFPPRDSVRPRPQRELAEEIRERLRRSVRAQMVSDVPLGAFLSAGLDSSSIVALMAGLTPEPVRTYTITFPRHYRRGEKFDDPGVAAAVARHFGCRHQSIVMEPDVTALLPRLIWHMDEPAADPAIIAAYLVCREARKTVTVLLSGVGGDELFAGYRKHVALRWSQLYRALPGLLRRGLEPAVAALPAFRGTPIKSLVRLAKKMARSGSLAHEDAFLMNCIYLDEQRKAALYSEEWAGLTRAFDPAATHRAHFRRTGAADPLNQLLYLDTKVFMASLNLAYTDKMSMASSVEARVPFLDRELAEFVATQVPPDMKLKGTLLPTTKYALRQAMKDILPKVVLRQPKAPFGAPVDYWLAGELREMVDDVLSEQRIARRGLFRPQQVRGMIKEQRSGRQDWSAQLWQLLTFELWCEAFLEGKSQSWAAAAAARPAVLSQ